MEKKTINETAQLARIKVFGDEAQSLISDFQNIVSSFGAISKVDVTDIEPLYSPFEVTFEGRSDEAQQPLSPKDLLESAPALRDNEYLVPPVVS